MIKKVLLFAVTILGAVSCSKSDDNNFNGGNSDNALNNKILGDWKGKYEVIVEKPENQVKVLEYLKKTYDTYSTEIYSKLSNDKPAEFGTGRIVFSKKDNGVYRADMYQEFSTPSFTNFSYTLKENEILNTDRDNLSVATYTLENNKLIVIYNEWYSISDTDKITEAINNELEKLNITDVSSYIQKRSELVERITKDEKCNMKYKFKWVLNK